MPVLDTNIERLEENRVANLFGHPVLSFVQEFRDGHVEKKGR